MLRRSKSRPFRPYLSPRSRGARGGEWRDTLSRDALLLDCGGLPWSNSPIRAAEADARGSVGMAVTVGAQAPGVGDATKEPTRAAAPEVREISIDDLTECI